MFLCRMQPQTWLAYEQSDDSRSRYPPEDAASVGETCEREDCRGVPANAREECYAFSRGRSHPRPPHRIWTTQEVALLHLGTGRMVARSGILRVFPASSRQRRTSCLDETVINSAVSNFGKGSRARTYGYFAIGTESIHQHDPR